jgi:hypothetical protein
VPVAGGDESTVSQGDTREMRLERQRLQREQQLALAYATPSVQALSADLQMELFGFCEI